MPTVSKGLGLVIATPCRQLSEESISVLKTLSGGRCDPDPPCEAQGAQHFFQLWTPRMGAKSIYKVTRAPSDGHSHVPSLHMPYTLAAAMNCSQILLLPPSSQDRYIPKGYPQSDHYRRPRQRHQVVGRPLVTYSQARLCRAAACLLLRVQPCSARCRPVCAGCAPYKQCLRFETADVCPGWTSRTEIDYRTLCIAGCSV